MIVNLIKRIYFEPSYVMETKYKRLCSNPGVQGTSLGSAKSSYDEFDFAEYASQFVSSDFDVQSLLEVGAYDLLKPTYLSTMSSMSFADKFQNMSISKPSND